MRTRRSDKCTGAIIIIAAAPFIIFSLHIQEIKHNETNQQTPLSLRSAQMSLGNFTYPTIARRADLINTAAVEAHFDDA